MKTTTRPLLREDRGDNGFTLVEILVVIIIIGILAAIAIPIFLNQQRAARDSATIADVRNLAMNVETALAYEPKATWFYVTGMTADNTEVEVYVGTSNDPVDQTKAITVSKTRGTMLTIHPATETGGAINNGEPGAEGGAYVIRGWNKDGQEYTSKDEGEHLVYRSLRGGNQ